MPWGVIGCYAAASLKCPVVGDDPLDGVVTVNIRGAAARKSPKPRLTIRGKIAAGPRTSSETGDFQLAAAYKLKGD